MRLRLTGIVEPRGSAFIAALEPKETSEVCGKLGGIGPEPEPTGGTAP